MSNLQDPAQLNIDGVTQLVESPLNKIVGGGSASEGAMGTKMDELELSMTDEELLKLSVMWEQNYMSYEKKIRTRQEWNLKYYQGKQKSGADSAGSVDRDFPVASNLIFQAEETFIPAALAKNPEPVTWADNSAPGMQLAKTVKTMLQYHADVLVLRRKLALMVRHWSIYFLGVIKHGWDAKINDICSDVIKPTNLIMDENATIDVYGNYDGKYLGERKECTAQELVDLFPKHKEYITASVDGMMGTTVVYTEWWTNEYCFYRYKTVILDKHKNPNWNYDKQNTEPDEYGVVHEAVVPGKNHFARPKMPYTFLSVFNLGQHPHDITSLIEQNIQNQDLVNKRITQIDVNLDNSNNSLAVSGLNFTNETAKQAADALRAGRPVLVPTGNVESALKRFPAPAVPSGAFEQLDSMTTRLLQTFGTDGITPEPDDGNQTARGMILSQQFDNSRIGGGIGDALEQVADNIFNWWVQLYYVFYDEPHYASVIGRTKAVEFVTLQLADFNQKIVVSVSPNSMAPKDEVSEANQALSLWQQGAIDPVELYTRLNFPDPKESAYNLFLWKTNPQMYGQVMFGDQLARAQAENPMMGAMGGEGAPPPQPMPGESPESLSSNLASPSLSMVALPK